MTQLCKNLYAQEDCKVLCKKIILLGSSEVESFFLLKIVFNVVTLTFQLLKDYHLSDVPFYCSNGFAFSLKQLFPLNSSSHWRLFPDSRAIFGYKG